MAIFENGYYHYELVALSLVLASVFLLHKIRKREYGGKLPPGPWGLPLLGYLPFLRPDLHRCLSELAQKYGPVFTLRLGTKRYVVISSPAAAREVLRDHDATLANRDPTAAGLALTNDGRDIVWASHGSQWRSLRKICVRELLNPRRVDATCLIRRRSMRLAVAELHRGGAVEVQEVALATTMRVMMGALWGGTSDDEAAAEVKAEFSEVMKGIVGVLGETNVSDLFPGIGWLDLQGVVRRMMGFKARLDRILDGPLRTGKSGGKDGSRNFLQAMLELVERGDGDERLNTDHIKAVFIDLVTGGTDTTSTTIEWYMSELLHKPETMRRLVEELDAVVGNEAIVEEAHLPELHYLDAVIRETLRLHPVVPLMIPHYSNAACTVGGYTIPKDTRVVINAWAIHRDPNFWDEPLEFRPERFLTNTGNWDYNGGNDFSFLPFGAGRRICVGIPLAERMLKYVLATLLHLFEWRLPAGEGIELSDKFGIVLKKKQQLVAVPTARFPNKKLYE